MPTRFRRPLALVALAILAAVGPALAEAPAPEPEPGEAAPPPGPPADVALWTRGQRAGEAVVAGRAEAGRLQQQVKGERLLERLEAAAAAPGAPASLGPLRERLLARWTSNYELVARPWPIDPTRVCWYPMLAFDSALRAPAAASRGDLGQARIELGQCVERAELVLERLAESNRALAAAASEARQALSSAPPAIGRGG